MNRDLVVSESSVRGRRAGRLAKAIAAALLACLLPLGAFGEAEPDAEADPVWLAPAPRTDDGLFTNPVGHLGHGSLGDRFPFMFRRLGGLFRSRDGAPALHAARDAFFVAAGTPAPTVTWVGHATVLVQMDGVAFLTDPIWSDTPSPIPGVGPRRFVDPGLDFERLPPIDFVVVSHNHFDHLDLPTLEELARRNRDTVFYVPLANAALLREEGIGNVVELDWTGVVQHGDVEIHCLPAQHWSKRSISDTHEALWSSWAVIGPTRRLFYGGDTGFFSGFAEIGRAHGPFDLAVLPIGAYAPRAMMAASHMNPEEAFQAAVDLGAERALGVHFGTFDLADEPLDEPPLRFRAAAREAEGTPDRAWVFKIGETRPF